MPRKYIKIRQHEEELLKMKEQGLTHQEMANRLGYRKSQIKEFFCAYNKRQKKIASGYYDKAKRQTKKRWIQSTALYSTVEQINSITI